MAHIPETGLVIPEGVDGEGDGWRPRRGSVLWRRRVRGWTKTGSYCLDPQFTADIRLLPPQKFFSNIRLCSYLVSKEFERKLKNSLHALCFRKPYQPPFLWIWGLFCSFQFLLSCDISPAQRSLRPPLPRDAYQAAKDQSGGQAWNGRWADICYINVYTYICINAPNHLLFVCFLFVNWGGRLA